MNLRRVMYGMDVVSNLRSEGRTSRADYVEELINEIIRYRNAMLNIYSVPGRTGEDAYDMAGIAWQTVMKDEIEQ